MPNFHLENLKNKKRGGIFVSPYFFALALIFSVTFGLLFLNSFRVFKSDISVLIIPKNESASFQIDQIMENLTDITHRLSFYDRLLSDNDEIKDSFAGLSKDERKMLWNKNFFIERLPNSTTLNISIFNKDKAEANKVARQTALSLSEVASRFYNIQTELEFRIIEGPISSPFIKSLSYLILGSLFSGIFLAWLVLLAFNSFSKKLEERAKTNFNWDKIQPRRKEIARSDLSSKKAFAPSNLPVAEAPMFAESENGGPNAERVGQKDSSEIFPTLEEKIPAEKGEPTDEEYRERLNKLLRGEI